MNVWCAPAAAGKPVCGGKRCSARAQWAAFWLVRVDGAGPTACGGAVRVPRESWAARLSSLGVNAPSCTPPARRAVQPERKTHRLPHKKHTLLPRVVHRRPGPLVVVRVPLFKTRPPRRVPLMDDVAIPLNRVHVQLRRLHLAQRPP